MNLLITTRLEKDKHGKDMDTLEHAYVDFFESMGINLIPISNNTSRAKEILSDLKISGVILSGGEDIDSTKRDLLESELIDLAIAKGLPVLGICRGMQVINTHFGGKIRKINDLEIGMHSIEITDNKLKSSLPDISYQVNSYHNCCILNSGLGENIKAFAEFTKLGTVEGLYHKDHAIVGIEWHPERPGSSEKLDGIIINALLRKKLFWPN